AARPPDDRDVAGRRLPDPLRTPARAAVSSPLARWLPALLLRAGRRLLRQGPREPSVGRRMAVMLVWAAAGELLLLAGGFLTLWNVLGSDGYGYCNTAFPA